MYQKTALFNGSRLFDGDDSFATFMSGIVDSTNASATLAPTTSDAGIAGYKAVYDTILQKLYPTSGLIEVLFSINAGKQVAVQAALQLPLSQGRQTLQSSSVYDQPLIDPNYFSHPADIVLLRQGIKLARQIGSMAPLADDLADEVLPGPSVATDADIETWLRNSANTEFHPSGACAMLPREQGGVVDANLKVYGTANVRVVDSSVFPTPQTAHVRLLYIVAL
jgi:choline dehydrogenase